MKLNSTIFIILILSNLHIFSQNSDDKLSLDSGSINSQFEFITKKSSNYQNYKVVKRIWLQQLRKHVIDSLIEAKKEIASANKQIINHKETISKLEKKLTDLNTNLDEVTNEKEQINLLGIALKKDSFKTLFWAIISILLITLSFYIYKFYNSNQITKETLTRYDELEQEFMTSKSRALEREQILNRKLQDEINKHKNS